MQKKLFFSLTALLSALMISGCGNTTTSFINTSTNSTSISAINYEQKAINELYSLNDGTNVEVTGIVGQIAYSTNNEPESIILFDETGTIVVYGQNSAANVQIGNKVTITGSTTHYEPKENIGYTGNFQITNANIISNDNKINEIPMQGVIETTLKSVTDTKPSEENLSSKTFKVAAEIEYAQGANFFNINLHGADGQSFTYAYTKCSGADLNWLKQYNGQYRYVVFTVLNINTTSQVWRIVIDKVLEEAPYPTDEEMANYALEHAQKQFLNEYNSDVDFDLYTDDPFIDEASFEYNENSENIIINEDNRIFITVPNEKEEVTINITAKYKNATVNGSKTFTIKEFDTTGLTLSNIANARNMDAGTEITIKGYLAQFAYNKPLVGFYLLDETSSIMCYLADEELAKLNEAVIGSTVYVTGTLGSYNSVLGGCDELTDAKLLFQDYMPHTLPETGIDDTKTITDIYNTKPDGSTNYVGRIFKLKGIIEISNGFYKNMIVRDPYNYSQTVTVYTQNGSNSGIAHELQWLEEYNGKCVDMYFAVRNTKGEENPFWRYGVVAILGETEIPDSAKIQMQEININNAFNDVYLEETTVEIEKIEGVNVTLDTDSEYITDVSDTETYKYKITIPNDETKVSIDFIIEYKNETKKVTIDLTLGMKAPISISSFIDNADETNLSYLKGVVTAVQYKSGKTAFVLSDETASIFCYSGLEVKLGDEILVSGKYTEFSSLPQLDSPTLINTLSENNDVATSSGTITSTSVNEISENISKTNDELVELYANKCLSITGYVVQHSKGYGLAINANDTTYIVNTYANDDLKDQFADLIGSEVTIRGFCRGVKSGVELTIQVQSIN